MTLHLLGKPQRVLVVDDDAANIALLRALMEAQGYEVASAEDGVEALEQVAAAPPDLILLDVMMPGEDGYAVCRQLKQHRETRLVPIVLITSLAGEADRIAGLEAGADDFLTKPVSAAEVRARARSLLKLKAFTDDLEHTEVVLRTLALTLDARSRYTGGHSSRPSSPSPRTAGGLRPPPARPEAESVTCKAASSSPIPGPPSGSPHRSAGKPIRE